MKEYEKNPRFNDDAADYVANSIKEFGFKVPIIVDSNNVIVADDLTDIKKPEKKAKKCPHCGGELYGKKEANQVVLLGLVGQIIY